MIGPSIFDVILFIEILYLAYGLDKLSQTSQKAKSEEWDNEADKIKLAQNR